jgi:uncharacterized protein YxeA
MSKKSIIIIIAVSILVIVLSSLIYMYVAGWFDKKSPYVKIYSNDEVEVYK